MFLIPDIPNNFIGNEDGKMEKVSNEVNQFRRWKEVPNMLTKRAEELLAQPRRKIEFTGNSAAHDLLNDLDNYPHGFVLASLMDRQIKAERAWLIPFEISKELNGFEFQMLVSLDLKTIKEIFVRNRLHRFNDVMANNLYLAIDRSHNRYGGNASNIWSGNPRSATILRRFLQFEGVGIKIASIATNISARDFKIPMADKLCIDSLAGSRRALEIKIKIDTM